VRAIGGQRKRLCLPIVSAIIGRFLDIGATQGNAEIQRVFQVHMELRFHLFESLYLVQLQLEDIMHFQRLRLQEFERKNEAAIDKACFISI